ncbi:helix-turn-helix transcriptional regulator [Conexibacter sp. JD483]|uniref:PadR family transcriptional regulator n=1 Tax=unclassified Conexibacter TaxID=2627773 RepID=UPI00271BCA2F|nr:MULTISPECIES: helix-turn-helix transcriptional regulator [unclassified Conexibacter]MDO8185790.1 helix-turn-helix transcriptional regulator [Conexibacter sp. CPCC 205706]MDO8198534.1 helix-turn-helix transcriptional regulator [Conexibacter sp. CPCC 205762]MDR9367620.1 helix-turn-helix transcriptional regulator [Conexibacter sp. JD483]
MGASEHNSTAEPRMTRMRAAALAAAYSMPDIGYAIRGDVDERFGGFGIRIGSRVYAVLDELAALGLVEVFDSSELWPARPKNRRGSRRAFRITARGVQALTEYLRTPLDDSSAVSLTADVQLRLTAVPPSDTSTLRHILEMCDDALRRLIAAEEHAARADASLPERMHADLVGDTLDALREWLRGARKRLAEMEDGRG